MGILIEAADRICLPFKRNTPIIEYIGSRFLSISTLGQGAFNSVFKRSRSKVLSAVDWPVWPSRIADLGLNKGTSQFLQRGTFELASKLVRKAIVSQGKTG